MDYKKLYKQSLTDSNNFWATQADKFITWYKKYDTIQHGDFKDLKQLSWFVGGKLNACFNCVDRHLPERAQQTAIIWEGDDPANTKHITYAQLHKDICHFANALKKLGVKRGDIVCIYMPMIPEVVIAMLACVRIGAIHSVVFAGFSANALRDRIVNVDAKVIITADEGMRGGKLNKIKHNVDEAIKQCPENKKVVIVKNLSGNINFNPQQDYWYHELIKNESEDCDPQEMDTNDPIFILYTSGSVSKPKGIVHRTGGYMVYVACTFNYIFDYQDNDIYWCTADVGWITGHSYLVYGPLSHGATILMFEGTPSYPTYARYWEIIDKHQVNILYTSPTALRTLRRQGEQWLQNSSRKSLKLLGSVGEPINPDIWQWYYDVIGLGKCPIVDTWWQTETGGIMISPIPHVTPLKAGSVSWPFFGVELAIIDDNGNEITGDKAGRLIIKKPWPGMMQTVYNDEKRFIDVYFNDVPGAYLTGDTAKRDKDGYYWITGRYDDVIKVSGHRLGSEELESALISHKSVAEAAVVPVPNDITGEGIYAFVILLANIEGTEELKKELINHVRDKIGPIAKIETVTFVDELPKTRSGKILRRILRRIASKNFDDLGETSTLTNPEAIEKIIAKVA